MEEPTFPYAVANSPPTPTLRRRPWVSMRAIGPRNRRAAHHQEAAKPVRTGGKKPSRLAQPLPDAGRRLAPAGGRRAGHLFDQAAQRARDPFQLSLAEA